jgi:hypothetical protein
MPKKKAASKPIICPITGLEVAYAGRGRPPKYHPSAHLDLTKKRNADAYAKRKQKAKELELARASA